MASGAQASSYLDILGTVNDPILTPGGAVHSYSGPNLQPGVVAPGADLSFADLGLAALAEANLSSAILSSTDLSSSDMESANLGSAYLDFADLSGANLSSANLSSANLSYVTGLWTTFGSPDYDALTNFTGTSFDPVAAGWNLVPEPNTALLVGIGLVGMAASRRSLG